jgi:ectoine hydroxylase-related dioxygenase (phytanoyl-CoA dioxygenase family)
LEARADVTEIALSQEQIAAFHREGCVAIPMISTPKEVAMLLEVFTRLFAARAGRGEGAQFDMLSHDEDNMAESLPTIQNPIDYAAELRLLAYRTNALRVARQLLGPKAVPSFEHAILKPPRKGAATPWHQDEAYRFDSGFEYSQISVWMPLQQATPDNGCMHYIPGSHRFEVLPHRSPGDDPKVHAIECAGDFDRSAAVAFPLPAGGATIHHGRTLHYAGPNLTDAPRYAYILAFEIPPVRAVKRHRYWWNHEKQAAHLQRQQEWRRSGGLAIEAWRKFRRGLWHRPRQLAFELHRAMRALFSRNVS